METKKTLQRAAAGEDEPLAKRHPLTGFAMVVWTYPMLLCVALATALLLSNLLY